MNTQKKKGFQVTPSLRPDEQVELTLACIVKDEDRDIEEWVAFHLAVGVQRIIVIDNGPSEALPRILAPYSADGVVELLTFVARGGQQQKAYERVLRREEGRTRWLGFIDVDEFVFPSTEDSLREVLRDYDDYAAVAINWVSFGSSGHETRPDGLVIENYLERGELDHRFPWPRLRNPDIPEGEPGDYRPMNAHVKVILDPSQTVHFRTAHHYKYVPGATAVTEDFTPIDDAVSENVSVSRLRINHYWSKSLDDLRGKVTKGRVASRNRKKPFTYNTEVALGRDRAAHGVKDTEILRFLPATKRLLEKYRSMAPSAPLIRPRRLRYRPADALVAVRRDLKRRYRKLVRSVRG